MPKVPRKAVNYESVYEDTVACYFYSTLSKVDDIYWENLCKSLNETIDVLSEDYLWHNDKFQVHLPLLKVQADSIPDYLVSLTCYGDNIEDEWFIVYIVFEISRQYKDLVIQIKDSDGEFLLIEAANNLPVWAKPEIIKNRVFIYQNNLHIISPEIADVEAKLKLSDSISLIKQYSEQCKVTNKVEEPIRKRIGQYPEKIKENIHNAVVKLPLNIAALLYMKPSLISSIVNRYCNHDVTDAKICKNLVHEDYINVTVKFTKFMYAMLLHSKAIANVVDKNDKQGIIGLKLTCGFELLMCHNSGTNIFSSKSYNNFIDNLKETGYFKNNIEGSRDYHELLEKAKLFYSNIESPIGSLVSAEILQLMGKEEFNEIKQTLINQQHFLDQNEDNEDWLNVGPKELDDLLNTYYGKTPKENSSQEITSKISQFLNDPSDFEGIELNDISDAEEIDFDAEEFAKSLEKMLNLVSSENTIDPCNDCSDNEYEEDDTEIVNELDILSEKSQHNKIIWENIVQSLKEEKGSIGPSSNFLTNLGVKKSDLLDSDDDDDK